MEHRVWYKDRDRVSGLALALAFAMSSLWIWLATGRVARIPLVIAVLFGLVALIQPKLLAPANRLLKAVTTVLHRVLNRLLLTVIFFGCFLPVGLVLKTVRPSMFPLRPDPALPSYWRRPDCAKRGPGGFDDQF
ncbi:hypothetical protein [Consotaella aegiceratis]|uniref:hypothetical protein n=1 Tax=Consotaella aegiceratis TaxID=3097961 RepID=UPI002F40DFBB